LCAAKDAGLEWTSLEMAVRRPSVSILANTLQKAGLINYRRVHIRLLDVKGLQEGAFGLEVICEKGHYVRNPTLE
jgi:hypothetical protein